MAGALADALALGFAVATIKVGAVDFAPPMALTVDEGTTVGFALVAPVAFATLDEGFNAGRLVDDGRGFAADDD